MLIAVATVTVLAVPAALSVWALLDAARRPEWAWALAGRRRVVWLALSAGGLLVLVPGVAIALWYLLIVRRDVAAAEAGDVDWRRAG